MRSARPSVFGSPVLVGAITVLVVVVGVFLAYNANKGLPFVPTYDVNVHVPSGADLVVGNDVRVGGDRVGVVNKITPVRDKAGHVSAILGLKLDKTVDPLSKTTTVIVRPRSALGLKYVEITPGRGGQDLAAGDTLALKQARPRPVEIDEIFNIFNKPTRTGIQEGLTGFGNGVTGRGPDVNLAISAFRPLVTNLEPVARNLASPRTQLARFFRSLERAAGEVAPVAEQQAALFRNLNTTFAALVPVKGDSSARSCATPRRCSASCSPAPRSFRMRRRSWPTPKRSAPSRWLARRRSTRASRASSIRLTASWQTRWCRAGSTA